MKQAMDNSIPVEREEHLPYVLTDERETYSVEACRKLSAARCARVSYLTHDGKKPDFDRDVKLHDDLVGGRPIHASPTEHQATAQKSNTFYKNFRGWKQYREDVEKSIYGS
jgi:hypothetical protein